MAVIETVAKANSLGAHLKRDPNKPREVPGPSNDGVDLERLLWEAWEVADNKLKLVIWFGVKEHLFYLVEGKVTVAEMLAALRECWRDLDDC
jgi:hypothetical protein